MRRAGEVMVLPRIFFVIFIRFTPHFFALSPEKKFLKYFCIKYLTNDLAWIIMLAVFEEEC